MQRIRTILKDVFVLALVLSIGMAATPAVAEQCVDGVRGLVIWTKNAKGAAYTWKTQFPGHTVDSNASGCTAAKPYVLVYPKSYGGGINRTNGHVAVLKGCVGATCSITDSNGICGGDRKSCQTKPDFRIVNIIHP
jgi:hypothetical protein